MRFKVPVDVCCASIFEIFGRRLFAVLATTYNLTLHTTDDLIPSERRMVPYFWCALLRKLIERLTSGPAKPWKPLLMDNHSSRRTTQFILPARRHNIVPFSFPAVLTRACSLLMLGYSSPTSTGITRLYFMHLGTSTLNTLFHPFSAICVAYELILER